MGDLLEHSAVAQPRALICFWDGYIGVAPSVINAIRRLVEHGYHVDVVVRDNRTEYPAPPDLPEQVSLVVVRTRKASFDTAQRFPALLRKLADCVLLALSAHDFIFGTVRAVRGRCYEVAFGVDMFGLIAAGTVARTSQVGRLAYWSLEMYYLRTLQNPVMRWAKKREVAMSRKVDLVITQDLGRGHLLAMENGFAERCLACVPNAPMGRPGAVDAGFLKRRFALAQDTRIVLHAGWISDTMQSLDLARAAATWPDPYRLVFHERQRRSAADPYLRAVSDASAHRAILSLDPVPFDQLDCVYASAWVGVVFYANNLGPNYYGIAAASGKLAFCLRNGVPVVVRDLPSLKQLVDATGCGIAVSDPSEIVDALSHIAKDYDGYQARALKCFDRILDFRPLFDEALRRLVSPFAA